MRLARMDRGRVTTKARMYNGLRNSTATELAEAGSLKPRRGALLRLFAGAAGRSVPVG